MNRHSDTDVLFLVGPASVVDGRYEKLGVVVGVLVGERWYNVVRGTRDNMKAVIDELQADHELSCLMDRVFLVTDDQGIWAAGNAFFETISTEYEEMIAASHNVACARRLLDVAREYHPAGIVDPILDFGCGTGISSRAVIDAGGNVVGFDSSAAMRARARAAGISVRDALGDFADASINSVVACYVLHFGIRKSDALELARIVAESGVVVANFHKGLRHSEAIQLFCDAGFAATVIEENERGPFGIIAVFAKGQP